MADLIGTLASLKDAAWLRIQTTANLCANSTTLEQVQDYLKKGEDYATYAATASDIAGRDRSIADKLKSASDSIGQVRKGLSSTRRVCHDIKAASEISKAIAVLNEWSDGRATPAQAAQAFDQLFGGAARFAEKLPAPFDQYALILKQIGISRFFANMQNLMDPMGDTPRGRQLRQVMDEM